MRPTIDDVAKVDIDNMERYEWQREGGDVTSIALYLLAKAISHEYRPRPLRRTEVRPLAKAFLSAQVMVAALSDEVATLKGGEQITKEVDFASLIRPVKSKSGYVSMSYGTRRRIEGLLKTFIGVSVRSGKYGYGKPVAEGAEDRIDALVDIVEAFNAFTQSCYEAGFNDGRDMISALALGEVGVDDLNALSVGEIAEFQQGEV